MRCAGELYSTCNLESRNPSPHRYNTGRESAETRKFISLVDVMECPVETHTASSVIISHSETIRVRIRAYVLEVDERECTFRVHTFRLVVSSGLVWLGGRFGEKENLSGKG